MKKINKGAPLPAFTETVKKNKLTTWAEFSKFPQIKAETKKHLLEEQNGFSGYTERRIIGDNSHIDHYKKRAIFPKLTYDWNNLIVDEFNADYGACYKDSHISLSAEYAKLINPVIENPQQFFTYTENGDIRVKEELAEKDREKAQFTIDAFNLQHPALIRSRRETIQIVRSYLGYGLPKDAIKEALVGTSYPSVVEYILK